MERNEQCLCGSGKKYKHCCALKAPADINQLIEGDFIELQQEILRFAVTTYEESINNCINEFFEEVIVEDDEQFDQAGYLLMLWVIFSLPIAENNQTILQVYIRKHSKKIKRPALKEAIHEWQGAVPSIYKVVQDNNDVLYVKDIFTQKEKQIEMLGLNNEIPNSLEDSYILGTVINYRNRSFFFATFYEIKNSSVINEVLELYKIYADEFSAKQFIEELYPEIIETIFHGHLNLDEIPWDTDQQKQVVELFKDNLNVVKEIQKPIESLAISLWKLYCTKTGTNIRSIPKYAAALHYIVGYYIMLYGEDAPAKDELAGRYNVKIRTLTETIKRLDDVLEDDIDKMLEDLMFGFEEDEFDFDDDYEDDDYVTDIHDFLLDDDEEEDFFEPTDLFEKYVESEPKPVIDELAKKRAEKQKLKK